MRSRDLKKCLARVVECIGVNKTKNIWGAVSQAVGQDRTLLQATNVVLIYRERGSELTAARRIGAHFPPLRPWGFQFKECGTEGCKPQANELVVKNSHGKIQLLCQRCLWKSALVGESDVRDHFVSLGGETPNVYWHGFPASQELKRIFTATARERVSYRAEVSQ